MTMELDVAPGAAAPTQQSQAAVEGVQDASGPGKEGIADISAENSGAQDTWIPSTNGKAPTSDGDVAVPPFPSPSFREAVSLYGHVGSTTALEFSPDGTRLMSAGTDATIKIWSVRTGAIIRTLQGHKYGINDACWSKDSRYVASASDDKTIMVWNASTGELVRTLEGHTSYVFCLAFNPQGTLLGSGGYDETLKFWDLRRGRCHRTINAHTEIVSGLDFNREGTIVASCSYDGQIRIWDVTCGQCLKTLVPMDQLGTWNTPVTSVKFAPSSLHLIASAMDNAIRLWDIPSGRVLKTYKGHQGNMRATKVHLSPPRFTKEGPSTREQAIARYPALQRLPEAERERIIQRMLAAEKRRKDRRGMPEVLVVSGSEDSKVYVWDLQTKECLQTLSGHHDQICSTAIHPFEPIIASACLDNDISLRLWIDLSGVDISQS